jgi:DNA polymerase (family 10)
MTTDRVLLSVAMNTATEIVTTLQAHTDRVTYAGSLRRMRETIGDVDILATAGDEAQAGRIMSAFKDLAAAAGGEVIVSGPTKTSIRTAANLQVDLRVVQPQAWGAALQYFTGSQAHNVAVRQIAVRRGLKLSEYGLFSGDALIASATEEAVYAALGMEWMPPTMREDTGEVEAALKERLPPWVRDEEIRGDLHTHTSLTDGVATLGEMIAAAEKKGYEYYAVTDHAPNLVMQRMTDEKMLAQRAQLNAVKSSMTLLHGTELNIAPDGSVDWDEDFLDGFDICVASVHSHFDQDRRTMTKRFIAAAENPYVNIIGHPLTRKIGRRPPVDVDLNELFRACARTGTALEVNASPERLDLPSEHIRNAAAAGVKFAIDTDAHSIGHLDNMKYGVGTAQRGWLTADDVINAWPLERLLEFLRKGRSPQRLLASSIGAAGEPRRTATALAPHGERGANAGTRGGLRRRRADAVREVRAEGHLRRNQGGRPDCPGDQGTAAAESRPAEGADRRGRDRGHHADRRPGADHRPQCRDPRGPAGDGARLRDRPDVRGRDDRRDHGGRRGRARRGRRCDRRRCRAHGAPPDGGGRRPQPAVRLRAARRLLRAVHGGDGGEPARPVSGDHA